jgi:hypothetical protein
MMQMLKIAARQAWCGGALCLIGLLAAPTPAAAIQLVTEQEAALPPDLLAIDHRGIFGGAKVDPDSIVVTYKKTPEIDITQRIMPFITADGIDVPDAEVPPGTHTFRIEVKDNKGYLGATDFSFRVGK